MHFGRVSRLDGIDLHIPPDSARTVKFLALPREGATEIYVGCPVWAERRWLGELYPRGTKPTEFLAVYSKHFRTVEVNSTFYQLLSGERIAHWRDETPPGFKFCPKVFRGITEDLAGARMPELVREFCDAITAFDDRLGLTFAQFSDAFGPAQEPLLRRFLATWPAGLPLAVELRHPGWFHDHAFPDEIVNLFYRHRVATVITDTAGRRDVLHLSLTQPKVLVRFQGNNGVPSDDSRMAEWARRIDAWRAGGLAEIYFITHQPGEALIPHTAFVAAEKICGTPVPDLREKDEQLDLLGGDL